MCRNDQLENNDHNEKAFPPSTSSSRGTAGQPAPSGIILLQDIPHELRGMFFLRITSNVYPHRIYLHHDGSWGVRTNMYWLGWVLDGLTQEYEWEEEVEESGTSLHSTKNIRWGNL